MKQLRQCFTELDREKKAEPYFVYLKGLIRQGFTGRITIRLYKGGISKLHKMYEPIIIVEEEVILKR